MGDRAQVKIVTDNEYTDPTFLYTHWGGYKLAEVVEDAIARGERWNQDDYLARIIFEQMIDDIDERGSATGLGIGAEHGDVHTTVVVDVTNREVRVTEARNGRVKDTYPFSEAGEVRATPV